jgi:hypothetical protein
VPKLLWSGESLRNYLASLKLKPKSNEFFHQFWTKNSVRKKISEKSTGKKSVRKKI